MAAALVEAGADPSVVMELLSGAEPRGEGGGAEAEGLGGGEGMELEPSGEGGGAEAAGTGAGEDMEEEDAMAVEPEYKPPITPPPTARWLRGRVAR